MATANTVLIFLQKMRLIAQYSFNEADRMKAAGQTDNAVDRVAHVLSDALRLGQLSLVTGQKTARVDTFPIDVAGETQLKEKTVLFRVDRL